jgi:predicted nucleic acid-binding protein
MNDKYFLDTNILIYSFDSNHPTKRKIARDLVSGALEKGKGIISYQVIQEFLNVATRKFAVPLSLKDTRLYLNIVLEPLCEVFSSMELFHQALEISDQWKFPFYDALIVAAALQADCRVLYSEDMQDNQTIKGLSIRNPFKTRI